MLIKFISREIYICVYIPIYNYLCIIHYRDKIERKYLYKKKYNMMSRKSRNNYMQLNALNASDSL